MVTSHSDKQIHLWDLNKISQQQFNPIHLAESPLRQTTSSIQVFASGKGYAVGSIEGRVGVVASIGGSLPITFRRHCDGAPIGVKENFGRIKSVALLRIKGTMGPVGIHLPWVEARHKDVPVMEGSISPGIQADDTVWLN